MPATLSTAASDGSLPRRTLAWLSKLSHARFASEGNRLTPNASASITWRAAAAPREEAACAYARFFRRNSGCISDRCIAPGSRPCTRTASRWQNAHRIPRCVAALSPSNGPKCRSGSCIAAARSARDTREMFSSASRATCPETRPVSSALSKRLSRAPARTLGIAPPSIQFRLGCARKHTISCYFPVSHEHNPACESCSATTSTLPWGVAAASSWRPSPASSRSATRSRR